LQGNFSAGDNPMALRRKKVAGKMTDRGFYAKNAGVVFGELWLVTALISRGPVVEPGFPGHF